MSLTPGDRLGPYEIVSPLGAGGMGEVYRAHDPRLKRDVAIKILPDAFAADADRVARFQREAEVLASLTHRADACVGGRRGTREPVPVDEGEGSQRWPQVLPGSKAVVYSSLRAGTGNWGAANIIVRTLSGDRRVVLQQGGYFGRYASSGHLLYMHQGTMFAVPLDADRLEVTRSPVPAVQGVYAGPNSGGAQVALSASGTAVYLPGDGQGSMASIQWLDQTGKLSPLRATASDWSNPAFSPDGHRLAMDISGGNARPVWSPDSSRIAFASRRGDKVTFNLYWQRADGTGDVQRLTESNLNQQPTSFHPSGKYLTYFESGPSTGTDLMLLTIEGSERAGWKPLAPAVLLKTPMIESMAEFSPDGQWYSYLSNESGDNQLFVRPFVPPGAAGAGASTGGKWQISTSTADDPSWSRVRHELFFMSASDLRMMVSPYAVETARSRRRSRESGWKRARSRVPGRRAATLTCIPMANDSPSLPLKVTQS